MSLVKKVRPIIFEIILIILLLMPHIYRLAWLPAGFFGDELSIGYNAGTIAATGFDEHHQFLPIFFKAFGEYKNPVYIYATALLFRAFGVSEFNLRLTSFLFFTLFYIGIYVLVRKVFKANRLITYYAILATGVSVVFHSVAHRF